LHIFFYVLEDAFTLPYEPEVDFILRKPILRRGSGLYMRPCLSVPSTDFLVSTIFVKTHSEKTVISIDTEPGHTVQALKREIMDETGIPTNQQHISFDGEELEDDHTLQSYGIRDGSVLYMRPYILDVPVSDFVRSIFVKTLSGKTLITVEIKPGHSVRGLKREIMDETGMATNQQHITFDGEELEDDHTLHSYGIRDGSVLYMRPYREARCCKKCVVS